MASDANISPVPVLYAPLPKTNNLLVGLVVPIPMLPVLPFIDRAE